MSFQGQLTAQGGQGPSSTTLALTPEMTSTSGVLWEQGEGSEELLGDVEEGAVWEHYHHLKEIGVSPTTTPCPSPVTFHLPALRPSPRRHKDMRHKKPAPKHNASRAASSILRNLDPRVRFYITASNASDYVMSGKMFMRSATPVWNRAPLLGRGGNVVTSVASPLEIRQPSFERSPVGEGRERGRERRRRGGGGGDGGGKEEVKLNLEVMKLSKAQPSEETQVGLSPFALHLIQDHVPGMDITIVHPELSSPANNNNNNNVNTMVSQDTSHSGRPTGRSSNYGSATRRMGLISPAPDPTPTSTATEGEEGRPEEYHQPVHPFLRMYQTRPGAFARLLSRESDGKMQKVSPGSTIASLMVPHPVIRARERAEGEEEEEEEEEFAECVQGMTM